GQTRSGQTRSGQTRSGQTRSGQARPVSTGPPPADPGVILPGEQGRGFPLFPTDPEERLPVEQDGSFRRPPITGCCPSTPCCMHLDEGRFGCIFLALARAEHPVARRGFRNARREIPDRPGRRRGGRLLAVVVQRESAARAVLSNSAGERLTWQA